MKGKIQKAKLVYFSPTGSTRTIIQSIAHGVGFSSAELIDITKPDARKQLLYTTNKDLLIVGVPVYMGRVPSIVTEWLKTVKADNTPVVCVVVYGNRTYDNALIELKDILVKCGCKPIAGAAYIGEHSFSTDKYPTAKGRPDASDLVHAELFGHKIQSILSSNNIPDIDISGNYPYGGITELWSVDFITTDHKCIQCGICARNCPVGAINLEDVRLIDPEKCVTCCACIKSCPQKARTMKASLVKDASIRLSNLYSERKEPITFI